MLFDVLVLQIYAKSLENAINLRVFFHILSEIFARLKYSLFIAV